MRNVFWTDLFSKFFVKCKKLEYFSARPYDAALILAIFECLKLKSWDGDKSFSVVKCV